MTKKAFAAIVAVSFAASAEPAFAATYLSATTSLEYQAVPYGSDLVQYGTVRNGDQVVGGYNGRADTSYTGTPARLSTPLGTNRAGSASAYVDIAQGKLGAYAQANQRTEEELSYGSNHVNAGSRMIDDLTFVASGVTDSSLTTIAFEIALHGVFAGSGNWSVGAGLGATDRYGVQTFVSGLDMASATLGYTKGSATYTALSATEGVLRGSAVFRGAQWTSKFDVQMDAHADSYNVEGKLFGLADLGNTATIRFLLPDNVTMTSASGQFLTSGGAGAVPEPATWLTMVLGFGLVGAWSRHRRRGTTITA